MPELDQGPFRKINLLVVEDSPSVRAVLLTVLQMGQGTIENTFVAEDGEEALLVLENQPVDLVLTDLNMPVMNGIELIQRMSQDPRFRHIPVLAVTSEQSEETLNRLAGMGVEVIHKPFKPGMVFNAMKRILEARVAGSIS